MCLLDDETTSARWLAYALNERMARKAEYLREENRVLQEALLAATGKSHIPLTHEQRRRLATKGKALTPAEREECWHMVRPSTILAWFRQLVSHKYDSSQARRPGRRTVRYMVCFFIELKSRSVHVAGIRIDPAGAWMMQVARNLLDPMDGFPRNATHLIHDRDPLFTDAWTALLKSSGVKCVPIPAHSPSCSPHAERFVKTIRTECLDEFLIFGERHLRYLVKHFMDHYLTGRFHQGIGSRIIQPNPSPSNDSGNLGPIRCRSRLGGLLNFYHPKAV